MALLMPYSPSIQGNKITNISDLEAGRAPPIMPLTKRTHDPARVHRVYDKYSHYFMSTREEFLQDIIIESIPIENEEYIHITGLDMETFESIQADNVITEPSLVATNEPYFIKSTGRTEADVLADKFISHNNLWDKSGMCQRDTHFSSATKALYLLFGEVKYFLPTVVLMNPTRQTRQNMCQFKIRLFETCLSVRS